MEQRVPFHRQLKRERKLRGWSQADVATKVGSNTKTVTRWESGQSLPHPYSRQRLCELFGKNAEELGLFQENVTVNQDEPPDPVEETQTVPPHPMGTTLLTYNGHSSWVVALAWEPNGNRIASAGGDGTVRVWDAGTGHSFLTYRRHTWLHSRVNLPPTIYNIAWSPDGNCVASSGDGKKVYVWDAATGQTNSIYDGHSGLLPNVYAIAWSPDGKRIASACSNVGSDKTVHVWDVATRKTLLRYDTGYGLSPSFSVLALAWSPDGTRIASTGGDKTIRVWDTATGKYLLTCQDDSDCWVSDIAWSPNSIYIASANSDHTAQVWDTTTGKHLLTYYEHTGSVRDVAWSPDSTRIASASNDRTVQLWDAATGAHIFTYRGHSDWTTALAWSPDGTRIASASNDKTVQIWQAK